MIIWSPPPGGGIDEGVVWIIVGAMALLCLGIAGACLWSNWNQCGSLLC